MRAIATRPWLNSGQRPIVSYRETGRGWSQMARGCQDTNAGRTLATDFGKEGQPSCLPQGPPPRISIDALDHRKVWNRIWGENIPWRLCRRRAGCQLKLRDGICGRAMRTDRRRRKLGGRILTKIQRKTDGVTAGLDVTTTYGYPLRIPFDHLNPAGPSPRPILSFRQ